MSQELLGRVESVFPAPGFREYQDKAIVEVVKGLQDPEVDVVLLNAPTGSGKSLIIYTALKAVGGSGFITTPLNSLVDQLDDDQFIGENVITLKGRNNYNCIHPEDEGTPVNEAICQLKSNFECNVKDQCPYYGRKYRAMEHPMVVTNMSYLMAEGLIPGDADKTLGNRDVLAVDECQKLEDFAMGFISVTISDRTVPEDVWKNIEIPDEKHEDDMDYLVEWLRTDVLQAVQKHREMLDSIETLSKKEGKEQEELRNFELRVRNFIQDARENDWVAQKDVNIRKNKPNTEKMVFKPIEVGRFLDKLLWRRGREILLSSATIPGKGWLDEIGLGGKKVKKVTVPSTFPVENRPIIMDHAVGKMTMKERKTTIPKMAQKIMDIANHHEGEKGFVHCRSYKIADTIRRWWLNNGHRDFVKERVMVQDGYNREESLEEWLNSDKQVFLSVAMDEGVDLEGDKCRWQVLAKTLYLHMGDKRVKFRVSQRGEWDWYNQHAAIQLQQAYGRAVRSKDDEAVFYILDSSAKTLIQMNAELFNRWFLEAIADMKIDPSRGC